MFSSSTGRRSFFAPISSRSGRTRNIITAPIDCRPARCGCSAPSFFSSCARARQGSSRRISPSFSTNPRIPSARRSTRPTRGNRSEPPEDLIPQFPLMRAAVRAFGLVPIEQDRYEADDLIATYACEARERGADVLIISADKDLMQLIGDGVAMYDPASGEAGAKGAREERRIGVEEVQRLFRRAAGKGRSTCRRWPAIRPTMCPARAASASRPRRSSSMNMAISTHCWPAPGEIKQPKRRETLTDPESVALIKRFETTRLARPRRPLEVPLDDLRLEQPEGKTLVAFLKAMEFTTITKRAAEAYGDRRRNRSTRTLLSSGRRAGAAAMATVDRARLSRKPKRRPRQPRARQPGRAQANARYGERRKSARSPRGPAELAAARAALSACAIIRHQQL